MRSAPLDRDDQFFDADRRGILHFCEDSLMRRAANQAIKLLTLDVARRPPLLSQTQRALRRASARLARGVRSLVPRATPITGLIP
jgi:hypothetical protein